MPSDWKRGTISDLGTVVGGSTPSKSKHEYYTNEGISWITPKDLSNNKSKFISKGAIDITEQGLKSCSTSILPKGTVLFSSRAPIGYISIANNAVSTNQGFKSIIPHATIGSAYVYFYLKTHTKLIESMASGSTFMEVSAATMKNVLAIVPSESVINKFIIISNPIFEQQEKLEIENYNLAKLRDTLLPRLMRGEIDVSQVEI